MRVAIGADQHGSVTLEVRDDGCGLPADNGSQGPERAGRMGLAGMRERIAALGGRIDLESRPGSGLTLCVYLPAAAGATR